MPKDQAVSADSANYELAKSPFDSGAAYFSHHLFAAADKELPGAIPRAFGREWFKYSQPIERTSRQRGFAEFVKVGFHYFLKVFMKIDFYKILGVTGLRRHRSFDNGSRGDLFDFEDYWRDSFRR